MQNCYNTVYTRVGQEASFFYGTAHVKGKRYMRVSLGRPAGIPYTTRMWIAAYTRVLCVLHICMIACEGSVVEFSERAIVKTELRFNRKLQEANVDRSEGDGKLQASRLR